MGQLVIDKINTQHFLTSLESMKNPVKVFANTKKELKTGIAFFGP